MQFTNSVRLDETAFKSCRYEWTTRTRPKQAEVHNLTDPQVRGWIFFLLTSHHCCIQKVLYGV